MEDRTVLIKYSGNWADEIDVVGFYLVTENGADEIWERLKNVTHEFSQYVGSNQNIEWSNGNDLLGYLDRIDLSLEEAAVMNKLFPYGYYGKFPDRVFDAGFEDDDV